MPEFYLSRSVDGEVQCGCERPLFALLEGLVIPFCFFIGSPVSLNADYPAYDPNSNYETIKTAPNNWLFSANDGSLVGDLYANADCTVSPGFPTPIVGFDLPFEIVKSGSLYAIVARFGGYAGSDELFNGSGPIDTPIANTVGTGTITLSFA